MQIARACSQQIMSHYLNEANIVVVDQNPDQLKYNQFMAMIRIVGEELRLAFRAHFQINSARQLVLSRFGGTNEQVTGQQVVDAFKEYCNETAGRLKYILESSEIPVGHSLPFAVRGFNEMIFKQHLQVTDEDCWTLKSDVGQLDCSLYLYTTQHSVLEKLHHLDLKLLDSADHESVEIF